MLLHDTCLTIRWGKEFTSQDVNLLFRAIRHLTQTPLRFVCLTDDPQGLDPWIESRPIPDVGLPPEAWSRSGVWPKLSLYSETLKDLGNCIFTDIDMIVLKGLDDLLNQPEGMTFLNTGPSWHRRPKNQELCASTGFFAYQPRNETAVLNAFQRDPFAAMEKFQNEQDFVASHTRSVRYWDEGLIVSFKRHLCWRYGKGLILLPLEPGPDVSVVAFHGSPRPKETWTKRIWGPTPHWHAGRVPWIEEYRQRYGDPSPAQ